jgi:hypothetical protein
VGGVGGAHPPGASSTAGTTDGGAIDGAGGGSSGATGAGGGGSSGTTGSGGGGSSGTIGAAGTGGSGGTTGSAGAGGGSGGAIGCTITPTSLLAPAIPTVGIVTFTTDLPGITGATIQFGLASTGPTMTAPVDLTQASYRTLLLGMKASSAYVFRIVASSGAGTCTSANYPLTTGLAPSTVRTLTTTIVNPAAHAKGFIVLGNALDLAFVYIVDAADGRPVWGAPFPGLPSRAHMSWDGRDMYMVALNASNAPQGANIGRISMDGTDVENNLSGLPRTHHDFTVIPGGIAALLWNGTSSDSPNSVVERSRDGTLTTVIADLADVYNSVNDSNRFHPASIHYHAWDDSYTIGDPYPHLYVKITRKGELVWQLGGSNPKDPSKFFQVDQPWTGENHGHHLLADGTFLFFNNLRAARVFKLDAVNMTATRVLSYEPTLSPNAALGDVQRLPNGNILVTYSVDGIIHEIDPAGQLVATFQVDGQFGYAEFRETLYGPPPY